MALFPEFLEDDHLRLRPLVPTDLPEISRQLSDDRVAPWLAAIAPPFDDRAAQELLSHSQHPGEHLRIIEQDGVIVGGICIGATLWYWLAPQVWGQGLMRRALTLLIATRFADHAPPLIATCHEENAASRGLLTRLGFSLAPTPRRMFFHPSGKAETCRDYLMAPEQWHLLHPPEFTAGLATLRPAQQKDAPALSRLLPSTATPPWPAPTELEHFIELHRFRGQEKGLFIVMDDNRRIVGMALITRRGNDLLFSPEAENARHRRSVEKAMAERDGPMSDFSHIL